MEYEISFDESVKAIVCRVSGDIFLSEAHFLVQDILDSSKKYLTKRIIFDLRNAKFKIEMSGMVDLSMICDRMGLNDTFRTAAICHDIDLKLQFYERLSNNKSKQFKLFVDEKKAKDWILSE
jgi:hypothetical protein